MFNQSRAVWLVAAVPLATAAWTISASIDLSVRHPSLEYLTDPGPRLGLVALSALRRQPRCCPVAASRSLGRPRRRGARSWHESLTGWSEIPKVSPLRSSPARFYAVRLTIMGMPTGCPFRFAAAVSRSRANRMAASSWAKRTESIGTGLAALPFDPREPQKPGEKADVRPLLIERMSHLGSTHSPDICRPPAGSRRPRAVTTRLHW